MKSAHPLAEDLEQVLAHTGSLWEELRGGRIFITGGTGFFGCWLLESFVWANDHLRLGAKALVLTRDPEAFRRQAPRLAAHPALQFLRGDVRDFAFPPGPFDAVLHAATDIRSPAAAQQPLVLFETIVNGTRRVLDLAAQAGAKKFLLTSSGAVYGPQPPSLTHIPETYGGAPDPLNPREAYGAGKRAAEMLCALYAQPGGLEPKIARCFAFVGPYLPLDAHIAIGNFLRDALGGGPIYITGDGTPWRSYLYAADLAIWLWTILFRGAASVPYNVGSEDARPLTAWADLVAGNFTPRRDVCVAKKPVVGRPPERYVPQTTSARERLGLRQLVEPSDAIRRTVRFEQQRQGG